jgi:hypothetical protein
VPSAAPAGPSAGFPLPELARGPLGPVGPMTLLIILSLLLTALIIKALRAEPPAVVQLRCLRCELLTNLEGIDPTAPRLSCELSGPARGLEQTVYQVLVASPRKAGR